MRIFCTLRISWNKISDWPPIIFQFGSKNWDEQFEKPPCMYVQIQLQYSVIALFDCDIMWLEVALPYGNVSFCTFTVMAAAIYVILCNLWWSLKRKIASKNFVHKVSLDPSVRETVQSWDVDLFKQLIYELRSNSSGSSSNDCMLS